MKQYDPSAGYRFSTLELGAGNSDSLFVILSFSGGGTRAAALAYGVLETLNETRIVWEGEEKSMLNEVDMISSVSGGSFPAAYYALKRKAIFDGQFEEKFLKENIQLDLIMLLFNPLNLFKLALPSYSRSDLAAEYYSEHIFDRATYAKVVEQGTRPFVLINATDMTLGSQFPFIQDQFDPLFSDLNGVELARAVATSSAFPGLLSPLTYNNYYGKCGYKEHLWVDLALNDIAVNPGRVIRAENRKSYYTEDLYAEGYRDYVHLVDGGVADNIGMRGLIDAVSSTDSTFSILQKINNEEIKKIVVIVVDASANPDTSRDRTSSVPNVLDNLLNAATTPLANYSEDTIELLEARIEASNSQYKSRLDCAEKRANACSAAPADAGELAPIDLSISVVGFDYIRDPKVRHHFKNIDTNFYLPSNTIDELSTVACTLLTQNQQFQDILEGKSRYTGTSVDGELPLCE